MTCSWCNLITYIDVVTVRYMMAAGIDPSGLNLNDNSTLIALSKTEQDKLLQRLEGLPVCRRCKRSDKFVIGPHDFSKEIEERTRLEIERKLKFKKAAMVIQKCYRAYIRRAYSTAAARAKKAQDLLYYQAVTMINRIARGRLARRVFATEKCLALIKESHPILLNYALKSRKGQTSSVFWYKRADEVKLLYDDYVLLAARTGFQPPRVTVEKNIAGIFIFYFIYFYKIKNKYTS